MSNRHNSETEMTVNSGVQGIVWEGERHSRLNVVSVSDAQSIKDSVLLREKCGGLSLTSVRVIVTEVVPERPPIWPTMSLAWMTKTYWSFISRSMLGIAVRMMPGEEKEGGSEIERGMTGKRRKGWQDWRERREGHEWIERGVTTGGWFLYGELRGESIVSHSNIVNRAWRLDKRMHKIHKLSLGSLRKNIVEVFRPTA